MKTTEETIKNLDVNQKIIDNTLLTLNYLSIETKPETIYKTKFGTIILDWEKEDKILSLEVAKQSFGYFIEVGGKDIKQRENTFEEGLEELKEDFKKCNIN
jgi:hypothetical protein